MNFDPNTIRQGNANKRKAEESPTTFATEGGSSFSLPSGSLDQKNGTRFAGPGGAYAMELQNNPNLAIATQKWNQQFMQSNQGMQFNQAKMMLGGGGPA
jgi:hypothetical protein